MWRTARHVGQLRPDRAALPRTDDAIARSHQTPAAVYDVPAHLPHHPLTRALAVRQRIDGNFRRVYALHGRNGPRAYRQRDRPSSSLKLIELQRNARAAARGLRHFHDVAYDLRSGLDLSAGRQRNVLHEPGFDLLAGLVLLGVES